MSWNSAGAHVLNTFKPLSANPIKWSNIQTIRWQQPANCLSVFNHFVGLALKGLRHFRTMLSFSRLS